ncbi:hypothetical protein [Phycicoccus avicenniae]|uniref:hypothetical protein n=1 Tax=Phycicoccus avicenniae TaxID=2828860 RepID=UPI003D281700
MPRAVLSLAPVLAVLLTVGCGQGSRVATLADDVARATRLDSDEVLRLAQPEADAAGRSTDDLLRGWSSSLRDAATRYREVPAEERAVACDAVTTVLSDSLDGNPATDPNPLLAAASAVAGANPTVGRRALADDLTKAAGQVQAGQPSALTLLMLKTGVCQVAGA